jgi:hypothetical protein
VCVLVAFQSIQFNFGDSVHRTSYRQNRTLALDLDLNGLHKKTNNEQSDKIKNQGPVCVSGDSFAPSNLNINTKQSTAKQ